MSLRSWSAGRVHVLWPDTISAMTEAFDLVQELAAVRTRQDVWGFIKAFTAAWASGLTADDGVGDDELDAAERRLGLRLPVAVREAYALFGRRDDLTSNQDQLLNPADMYVDGDGQALVFRDENQGAARWGVLMVDLDKPDPPVWIKLDLADKEAERWEAWLETFSSACVEIVLSESLFASDELADNRAQHTGDTGVLVERFARLALLPDYPTSQVSVPGVRWFAGADLILRDDQRMWLWVRARTASALDGLRVELPGDWMSA
jgi:hypothetical protein